MYPPRWKWEDEEKSTISHFRALCEWTVVAVRAAKSAPLLCYFPAFEWREEGTPWMKANGQDSKGWNSNNKCIIHENFSIFQIVFFLFFFFFFSFLLSKVHTCFPQLQIRFRFIAPHPRTLHLPCAETGGGFIKTLTFFLGQSPSFSILFPLSCLTGNAYPRPPK